MKKLLSICFLVISVVFISGCTIDDLANEHARKSGMAIEVISEAELKERELINTGETNIIYPPGEIPESLKISNFEKLYVVDIVKKENTFQFNVRNWDEEMATIHSADVVVNVEFTNNPGHFEEYTIKAIPEGQVATIPAKQKAPFYANLQDNPELLYKFIKSYEVIQLKFE